MDNESNSQKQNTFTKTNSTLSLNNFVSPNKKSL